MHAYKRPEPIKRQDNQRGLEIIFRSRAELKPDPANPRQHSKKQINQIAKSIRVFGFIVPVLVDRDSNVIAGHGRLLACGELGIDEVPTSCLEHLTPAQARAFRIADNKLGTRSAGGSVWAKQLLARRPTRIVTVALANKAARIIWALLTREEVYRAPQPQAA